MEITKTTSFVLPMLGIDMGSLIRNGFKNAYLGDENLESEQEDIIAIIFDLQKVKRGLRARMKRHTQYRTHYETDKCLVCLFDTNEYQKKRVIRHFLDGSYSRISKTYVNRYFQKRNPDGTKSLN